MIKLLTSINLSVKKWLKNKLISLLQSFIRRWGNILNINSMLMNSTGIKLVDLSFWAMNRYPSTYQTMTALDSAGISYLSKVKGTNMESMFGGMYSNQVCPNLTTLNTSSWDTSEVTSMRGMFGGAQKLTTVDISGWDTSKVTDMSYMFTFCRVINNLNVSSWNTANVTNMCDMFYGCDKLTTLNCAGWNTSKVTDISYMFGGCDALTSVGNLGNWNVSKVTSMRNMFEDAPITSINVSTWNTSACSSFDYMFCNTKLTSIDLGSNFTNANMDMSSDAYHMLAECTNLKVIRIASNTFRLTGSNSMFEDDTALQYLILDTTSVIPMGGSNIEKLNTTCKILVPASLLNSYKGSTNWSSRSSQFDSIANYTITRSNGQVTVVKK